jgi:hypothetical protein
MRGKETLVLASTDIGSNREEHIMATKRPSYLKRLKEQKRNAKALEKRDARKARKQAKSAPGYGEESTTPD